MPPPKYWQNYKIRENKTMGPSPDGPIVRLVIGQRASWPTRTVWNRSTVVMVPSPKAIPIRYIATPKRRNPSSTSPQRATLSSSQVPTAPAATKWRTTDTPIVIMPIIMNSMKILAVFGILSVCTSLPTDS